MKIKENYVIGGLIALVLYFLFVKKGKSTPKQVAVRGEIEAKSFDVSPNSIEATTAGGLNIDIMPSNLIPEHYDPSDNGVPMTVPLEDNPLIGTPTTYPMPSDDAIKNGGSYDRFGNFIPATAVIDYRPNYKV